MMTWRPLDTGGPPNHSKAFSNAAKAAKAGHNVTLHYTSVRGWYGWMSVDEFPCDRLERVYPVLSCDHGLVPVCESVILKAADAIRQGAPDEI